MEIFLLEVPYPIRSGESKLNYKRRFGFEFAVPLGQSGEISTMFVAFKFNSVRRLGLFKCTFLTFGKTGVFVHLLWREISGFVAMAGIDVCRCSRSCNSIVQIPICGNSHSLCDSLILSGKLVSAKMTLWIVSCFDFAQTIPKVRTSLGSGWLLLIEVLSFSRREICNSFEAWDIGTCFFRSTGCGWDGSLAGAIFFFFCLKSSLSRWAWLFLYNKRLWLLAGWIFFLPCNLHLLEQWLSLVFKRRIY